MTNTDVPPNGCGVCSAPSGDDAYLCRTHTDELRDHLAGVPRRVLGVAELAAELDLTVTRQARTTRPVEGGRSGERPLPWNDAAAGVAVELNAIVNAWALEASRIREDERDQLVHVHHSDTAGVAEWLARNLATLRMHQQAHAAYDEILSAVREARRAIDRPSDPVPFGECQQVFEDGTLCRTTLYGHLDRPQVRCRGCGALHPVRERLVWMLEHLRGMLATIPELVAIASLAGKSTTADKLRLMHGRGRFLARGCDEHGQPTFGVADVLKAIDDRYVRRPKASAAA